MQFSADRAKLAEWMPLMMEGGDKDEAVAATSMPAGTDVNFGALTRSFIAYLQSLGGVSVHLKHEVLNLHRDADSTWSLYVNDKATSQKRTVSAKLARSSYVSTLMPKLESKRVSGAGPRTVPINSNGWPGASAMLVGIGPPGPWLIE